MTAPKPKKPTRPPIVLGGIEVLRARTAINRAANRIEKYLEERERLLATSREGAEPAQRWAARTVAVYDPEEDLRAEALSRLDAEARAGVLECRSALEAELR